MADNLQISRADAALLTPEVARRVDGALHRPGGPHSPRPGEELSLAKGSVPGLVDVFGLRGRRLRGHDWLRNLHRLQFPLVLRRRCGMPVTDADHVPELQSPLV